MHANVPAAFGLTSSLTEQVVRLAGMAPSLHNSQPWRFRVLPHLIELHADPKRHLPVADPEDQELRLACGDATRCPGAGRRRAGRVSGR
ncbi:hypothetical protein ACWEV3_04260 [Saccharopolyspora sp. NPDC003752]